MNVMYKERAPQNFFYNNAFKEEKQLNVAIYCRLSQEDRHKKTKEEDSESIKNQKIMLTEYANAKHYNIVGVFVDEDWAGMNQDRPAYNQVLELAERREINIVLCKSLNRFTRDSIVVEQYVLDKFKEWNVRFIGIVDGTDSAIKGNKKSIQINGLTNQWYIEDMSDSIKSALDIKREKGEYIGSVPLYGYLKDPNQKGHLIIDPIASKIVREIFTLYNKGMGKTAIARELNNKGIPNPTQYKVMQNISYKIPPNKLGTQWKYFSISDILNNEMYIGNMVQGKYGSVSFRTKKNKPRPKEKWFRVEGTHEPIIDIDLWNSVQMKINKNFKPYKSGKIGVFAQKCKCMYCDYTLKSCKSHNVRYLRCPTRQVDKESCIGSFISENVLKKTVLNEINLLIKQYLNVEQLEENVILTKVKNEKEQLQKEVMQYDANFKKYSIALKDLFLQKTNGNITEDEFKSLNNDLRKDKENIENILNEKKKRLLEISNEQEVVKSKQELLEQYINVTELSREMVDNLIDYIAVGQKDSTTKKKTIEIHWKI